ncbi:hypothetical protein DNF23_47190 [Pseudomonas syringae pv. pisi]|nr:hypothetical protein AL061_21405 [Pseudomonas syringae pv. syringae]PPS40788.1 hypothetical protein B0F86_15100 [Pseudomonas syringae]
MPEREIVGRYGVGGEGHYARACDLLVQQREWWIASDEICYRMSILPKPSKRSVGLSLLGRY